MKKLLIITATFSMIQLCNAQTDSIGYFGQTPPGDTAVIFAPGIISENGPSKTYITFTPDGNECYYSVWGANFLTAKIFYTKRVDYVWSAQVEAPFSIGNYVACPFLSSDGNKLYFNSGGTPDIWMVQRTAGGWGDHQVLPSPINTTANWDYSYSETTDGRAYITSNRPGGQGAHDIWRIVNTTGQPSQVVNLGPAVNSSATDYCPYVAPDGSYLLFVSERPGGHTSEDIYVTFNKGNDEWTSPINLEKSGARININGGCADPTLSPDGRYLFFSRDGNIYWVSAKIIDKLRHLNFTPYLKSKIANQTDTAGHSYSLTIPDSTFIDDDGNNTLTYSATLSNGKPLPSWLLFNTVTKTFSGTPDTTGTFTIKISATDTAKASASTQFILTIRDKPVSVNQVNEQNILMYPNPTIGQFTITFGSSPIQKVLIEVSDLQGKQVFSKTFQNTIRENLNLNVFHNGMYNIKVIADGACYERKILKE